MEAFALYLFRSVVWLTGFALVYLLFLRNERYFLLNRVYLLAGTMASIVFPFFTWHYTVLIPFTPTVEVSELQMTGVVMEPEAFPTKEILLILYMAGALYLLYRITRQTVKVIGVIRQSEILPYRSAKLIRTPKYPASFSFFSFVFVNPSNSETETREIVNHELEHVRQRHWIDLVLFELLCTLQWFNPMVWLYGRFIRQNHEFLADRHALQRSANPAIYRAALINQLFGGEVISLANSFSYSINKKRFHMMKNTINPPYRKLKLLLILPIMAGVFYAFATPEYRYVQAADNSIATIQEATPVTDNIPTEVQDTVKSSVFTLEGNFVAPSPIDESSPVSGFRFSAKKIQGQYGKGKEVVKGEEISLDLGNTTSTIFIDGKEATKAEFDKLDPNTIASVSILKGEPAISKYGDKGKYGVILISLKKVESNPYTQVEQMPEFPGGEEALKIYMVSNIKYPEIALENGIQGKVFISFVVNKEGRISNAKVIRSIDPVLDQEALRVVESMPSWIPGKQNGKEVDVQYTLPVEFKFPKELGNKNTTAIGYASYNDPQFPGGEEALKAYIAATKKYPADVLENGIIGRVVIGFIVNEKGEIKSAKIVRGVHPSLDQEALRVINLMPNWIPANKNEENISAAWEIAVGFPKTAEYPGGKSGKIIVPSNKKAEVKPTINQAGQVYELIIIPNPTSDKARITVKDSDYTGKLQISVFDMDGKLIHKDTKTGPTFNLSFGNYTSGNYFIVVKAGKDQYSGHLIVNH